MKNKFPGIFRYILLLGGEHNGTHNYDIHLNYTQEPSDGREMTIFDFYRFLHFG